MNFPVTNPLVKFVVFSYLSGCEIFHRIALTSKRIRDQLPDSGLLNQIKVITIKHEKAEEMSLPKAESFLYAIRLADGIQLQLSKGSIKYADLLLEFIRIASVSIKKQEPFIDVIFKLGGRPG